MFDVKVANEQYSYAERLIKEFNFGMRGKGDGTPKEQLTGMIGQTVLADLLHSSRPSGDLGFDGGVDFIINNKKVDLKTMSRTTSVRDYYVHNFIGYQLNYSVDYYIFASFNTRSNVLTFCGVISKSEFLQKSEFYPKGTIRTRSDGTQFRTFAPLYETKQSDLISISSVQSICSVIK